MNDIIELFEKETGYKLEIRNGKPYCIGDLDLRDITISSIPNDLTVDGNLLLKGDNAKLMPENLTVLYKLSIWCANIKSLPNNLVVRYGLDFIDSTIENIPNNTIIGGWLNLNGTEITELPDNLTIGGSLYLRNSKITSLPHNLTVGGGIDLSNSSIKTIPQNLTVHTFLDLGDTNITSLPDNLTVGGYLDLEYSNIIKIPNNLTVYGYLCLEGTKIEEVPNDSLIYGCIYYNDNRMVHPSLPLENYDKRQKFRNEPIFWESNGVKYIKVDDILSIIDSHHGNVYRTHQVGYDKELYIVTDGENNWAHGETLKEAKLDLIYKISDRDTSTYKNMSLDDVLTFEEAIIAYRTITGACSAGTRDFIEHRLPEPRKKTYTIGEIIEMTDNEYGSDKFKVFFGK
jgi:leucine-rich repeat protein